MDEWLEECASAFVFFTNRYSALVATEILQSSNPMSWVTNWAPDPHDVYWSNLWIPYRQLWLRRIATLCGSIVFMFLYLIPVTFVQGLTQLDKVQQYFPFLKGILEKKYVSQLLKDLYLSVGGKKVPVIRFYILPFGMFSLSMFSLDPPSVKYIPYIVLKKYLPSLQKLSPIRRLSSLLTFLPQAGKAYRSK